MPKVIKKVQKSVCPVYLAAAVWAVLAMAGSLYRPVHYITAAVLSFFAYLVGRKLLWQDVITETVIPDPPPKPESTGDPELDALIRERDMALSEMHRLNDNIQDEKISRDIDALELLTRRIIEQVLSKPEKLPKIRKFLNYYLPTTLKILNAYDRMGSQGVAGENIDGTMRKIDTMLDTILHAFERQLDNLFSDEALDIQTDITVLENMLVREGLSDSALKME